MPDVVVVIPGILGSALRQRGREVWNLSAAAGLHALGSLGGSVSDLMLTDDSADPAIAVDEVEPAGLLRDLHLIPYLWKIDGYSGLLAALTGFFRLEAGRNLFEFAYDWRRDNRVAAKRLNESSKEWLWAWRHASGNHQSKLIIIAHSMGGLVARYYLEVLEGWRDTKVLITFGTPYRGSVNALSALTNGIRKGPFGVVDVSSMVRSLTSVYQLLPIYPCVQLQDHTLVRLTEAPDLPNVSPRKIRDAASFHDEIRTAVEKHENDEDYQRNGYWIFPIVGTHQETLQSAKLRKNGLEFLHQQSDRDLKGDGTVPRISATPIELSNKRAEVFAATCHASLQNSSEMLHHVTEVMAGLDIDLSSPIFRYSILARTKISVATEDAYWDDEEIRIRVLTDPQPSPAMTGTISDAATGREIARLNLPAGREGWIEIMVPPLLPGTYRVSVQASFDAVRVTDVFAVYRWGN